MQGIVSLRTQTVIRILLPLAILCASYWLLREQLSSLDLESVQRAISAVTLLQLAISAVATLASYCSLAVVERILFETTGVPVYWRRALLGSFIANSVSASVGLVLVSAAILRLRIYGRWSVSARDAIYVSLAFAPVVILSGLLGVGLMTLLLLSISQPPLSIGTLPQIGLALLFALPATMFLAMRGGRELTLRQLRFVVPSGMRRLALVVAGLSDWAFASCALFSVTGITLAAYPQFQLQFIFGWLFGAAAGLPAGAGAIDAVVIRSFSDQGNLTQLAAGLLLFRLIYFAIPTLIALALLAMSEFRRNRP
jgi:phosphatidylglycerol lysyltransferase